jgi:hypothetical protein
MQIHPPLKLLRQGFVALVLILASAGTAAAAPPIMPLSQVTAGMNCTGLTVVQGTTISSFNVHVIDVVADPDAGGTRILVSVSGPAVDATGIAEGFSGSPVECPGADGQLLPIGAISAGVGQFGNNVGLVTPIEQLLGEPVHPPSDVAFTSARATPLAGPLTVSGLSSSIFALLARAAEKAHRAVVPSPAVGSPGFPVQLLQPGAAVAIGYSAGAVSVGGIGTVTLRDGDNVYTFGHELDGAGRRSLVMQDAYVYGVVGNPNVSQGDTSYKLAAPGHVEGTVTADTPNGVIGVAGAGPPTTPLIVNAHDLDTGRTQSEGTRVADETDVGDPGGTSLLTVIAPLAVAQAAIDVYDGAPAAETGAMCLTVNVREIRGPLRFCNRYLGVGGTGSGALQPPELALSAGGDVGTAFSLLDSVAFSALHVVSVTVELNAQRGLHEASIVSAAGPRRARAGQRVRVRLTVRLYRGPLRTITIPLRIPPFASGRTTVTISQASPPGGGGGPPSGNGGSSLVGQLSVALGGGPSGPSGSPPSSVAALRRAFTAIGTYDGLRARIAPLPAQNLYRDPNLMITGSARFHLFVN